MFFLVFGILQAGTNNTLLVVFLALGAAFLAAFFFYIRARERAGKEPLLSTELFRNRTSNLGLVTQNLQWLLADGRIVCRLRLPADRAPLQRDQDGRDLHRRHAGDPRLLARGGAAGARSTRSGP